MAFIHVGEENSAAIQLYYEDHGSGRPVVLIHGFPLNGHSWEKQEFALLREGYRVITYDRRGFGQSSKPSVGYDYDTFAADLSVLLQELNLFDASLVGFSMGTGEVVRYLSKFGSSRVRDGVLIGPLQPFLLKTNDNPEGLDQSLFDGFERAIVSDRPAFLKQFLDNFFNVDKLGGTRISNEAWQASFTVASQASPIATRACVPTWHTDFRADLPKLAGEPLLIIQGDEDRILPIAATGQRLRSMLKAELVVIRGGPHAICWTHADEVNAALLRFLGQQVTTERGGGRAEHVPVH
jgi:non-heme chloroperoxidase